MGTGVITGAIGSGPAVLVLKAGHHLELLLEWLQRLHRPVEAKVRAFTTRPPRIHDGTVRKIEVRHAQRRAAGSGCRAWGSSQGTRSEDIQGGQRDRCSHSPEHSAAIN